MEVTLDSIRDIRLYQPRQGYRFSVDSLLLFSFVRLREVIRIADLGAGSGVIGLLLAKKYPNSSVTLIELQSELYELAKKNIVLNNLQERVIALMADIREISNFKNKRFDLVVSNPPFRKPLTGLMSGEMQRAIARHEITLRLEELIKASSELLKYHGRLCLIHLPERLSELIEICRANGLEPKRLRFVHSKPSVEAKMLLIEAVKQGRAGLRIEPPFFIYREDGSYTEEMELIFQSKK